MKATSAIGAATVQTAAVCASTALTAVTTTAVAAAGLGTNLLRAPGVEGHDATSLIPAGASVTHIIGELLGGAPSRRCWRGGDRIWMEVRGLDHETEGRALGAEVLAAVRAHPGVLSAQLNYPLSRLVVQVDGSESPTVRALGDLVAGAEERRSDPRSGRHRPVTLPGDGLLLAASWVAVGTNAVGLSVALSGRAMGWPRLPLALSAAVTTIDYQPRLRRLVEDRLGSSAADTVIALAASTAYAVTQAPASLAVDLVMNLAKSAEVAAGSRAWRRHEPELVQHADCAPAHSVTRPRPLPPGPVERHADRAGLAGVAGGAVIGAVTGRLGTAATAAVVTAPKAARTAREAFASTLGRGLGDRHDVLVLRPEALRRLDRVDTVLLDPRALCTQELTISRIRGATDPERTAVWEWAQTQLEDGAVTLGWHPVGGRWASPSNGASVVEVLVRHAYHPLAAAVLDEARRAGCEVVSLDVDALNDVCALFDELAPAGTSVDAALAETVCHLQSRGATVAVVSSIAAQALSVADVAIGVRADDGSPPWHADVMVGNLSGVWQLVHALPAARTASRRGVEIATGASALGGLLLVPGVRGVGPAPVTAGAGAGLWTGYRLARGVVRARAPRPVASHDWHALSVEQVRRLLPTPDDGESEARRSRLVVTASRSAGVANRVIRPPGRLVSEFAAAVRGELGDPLTPVLALGAAASAVLGSPVDAILVGSVLGGNAVLAATQQLRAERLLRRLLAVQDPPARRVIASPGGSGPVGYDDVAAPVLRPGDVIEVRPGEVVPADARIMSAVDVEVDESSLTGESLPVTKQFAPTPGADLAERRCMLYAGSTVVAGTATAVVTAVGARTEARRATTGSGGDGGPAVGLASQLRALTNTALPFSVGGGGLVTVLGLLRGTGLRHAVSSGVAVGVAAVPEGLPLVATLAQQASARRLTKLGVLVRSPRAVEALGRVDVVCFDKTGTLSENRLRVSQVFGAAGFTRDQVLVCAIGATARSDGGAQIHATDAAVLGAAPSPPVSEQSPPIVVHLPFRSGRPFSASIVGGELSIKGAPEVILAACTEDHPVVHRALGEMATGGLRVLAVARRDLTAEQARAAAEDPDTFGRMCQEGLDVVGLLGLSDTPRPEAAGLLVALTAQGLGVRMITGDHPVTATAIAAELGLAVTPGQVITGTDWEALPRQGRERAVTEAVVFARMSPEHKVQVVQTLERLGQVCAMVGDGANDAAAIRAATVGVGVASHGSDPARTSADVMLLDGRIGSLLDALDEGRQLWRRVQAAVAVLLGGNAGEVAFAIIGTALTGRSPLNTRQLLLVNMLTDALPAAALAVSAPTSGMRGTGRGPDQAALWRTVAVRGTTTAAAATLAWTLASVTGRPARASTVALVALVATQLGQTLLDSHSPLVMVTAAGSLLGMGTLISIPGVSQLLGSTPLGPLGWSQALGTAALATAAAAVAPRLLSRYYDTAATPTATVPAGPPTAGAGASKISTTPARHNSAYTPRNGTAKRRVTASTNGSASTDIQGPDTVTTVTSAGIHSPNTP